jgi:hypothetical protein
MVRELAGYNLARGRVADLLWFYLCQVADAVIEVDHPAVVEGLMWIAIATAALKRFLADMTQLLVEVPLSTRKVATGARHVLSDLVCAFLETWRGSKLPGRRPSPLCRVRPNALIPNEIARRGACSWGSNLALRTKT